jgi:hypothetical protein
MAEVQVLKLLACSCRTAQLLQRMLCGRQRRGQGQR